MTGTAGRQDLVAPGQGQQLIEGFAVGQQARLDQLRAGRGQLDRLQLAFRTSGCPGKDDDVSACNRPYGDSSPTDILSFPFALARRDVAKVRRQLRGDDIKAGI